MFRLTSLVLALALAGPALAQDFARYTNPRFGVTALVPAGFAMQPPPENGDGAQFLGPAGGRVAVWGGWDVFGGLDPEMDFVRDRLAQVTYSAAGPGWQVVSGYLPNGEILYHRAESGTDCAGEVAIGHVEITYPAAAHDLYDALVETVAASLGFGPC